MLFRSVAALIQTDTLPYGRPSGSTLLQLLLRRLVYVLVSWLPQPLADPLWNAL